MSEINYLEVGKEVHCLYCHYTIPREGFLAHVEQHVNTQPIPCKNLEYLLDCPEWAKKMWG